MAEEKRTKATLFQELENVKDKFAELRVAMDKMELNESVEKCALYLNQQAALSYYGIIYSLGVVQDNYHKQMVGNKEVIYINEVFKKLAHIDDLKITYQNGFHVNGAITFTNKINVDENLYR